MKKNFYDSREIDHIHTQNQKYSYNVNVIRNSKNTMLMLYIFF
jgi:hypothetical protein